MVFSAFVKDPPFPVARPPATVLIRRRPWMPQSVQQIRCWFSQTRTFSPFSTPIAPSHLLLLPSRLRRVLIPRTQGATRPRRKPRRSRPRSANHGVRSCQPPRQICHLGISLPATNFAQSVNIKLGNEQRQRMKRNSVE